MKKPPDSTSIHDIIKAARLAQSFITGLSKSTFLKDLKTQAAISRQLEIVGEASNRLSIEFRKKVTTFAWKEIIGMRNILIHMYEEVDEEELWLTVKKDLPKLIAVLEPLLLKMK